MGKKPITKSIPSMEKAMSPISIKRLKISLGIIIAAFAFLLYINGISNGYTLDDPSVTKKNTLVTQGLAGIPKIIKTDYWYGFIDVLRVPEYRPTSLVVYAIVWQFFPENPHANHLVNILFFALTCFLLFYVLSELFNKQNLIFPFVCTLLYAAHPIHTEVVDSIKSLDEILCFLFGLSAIFFLMKYLASNSILSLIISGISFFLSLASKETGISFLLIIPLILFFFTSHSIQNILKFSSILIIISGIYFLIRYFVLKDLHQSAIGEHSVLNNTLNGAPDFLSRQATAFYILLRYILLLILPHPLSCDYSIAQIKIQNFSDIAALLALVCYLSIGIFALMNFKKKNILAFAILFYLLTLAPVSNIFLLIGSTMAERFMYMPSLGFCMILTYLLIKFTKTDSNKKILNLKNMLAKNTMLFIIAIAIVSLYSFKTYDRCSDWKDNINLFGNDARVCENSSTLRHHFAIALLDDAYPNEKNPVRQDSILTLAINELNKAKDILHSVSIGEPDNDLQLGRAYLLKKDFKNASSCYEAYRLITVPNLMGYGQICEGFNKMSMFDKILLVEDSTLKYFGPSFNVYLNKGIAYNGLLQPEKALVEFQKAFELEGRKSELFFNRGISYGTLNRNEEAIKDYSKAIELKADYVEAYINKANLLNTMTKYDEGLKVFNKAIELKPDFAMAYNNRGNLLANMKKYEEAVKDYSKAIELNAKYAKAYYNRGVAETNINQKDKACSDFSNSVRLGYQPAGDMQKKFCH